MMRTLPLLMLFSCPSQEPVLRWSGERAVAGIIAQLDTNGDGALQAEEYGQAAFSAPSFTGLDLDNSGALSPSEVLQSLKDQDPAAFDQQPGRPPVSIAQWRKALPRTAEARGRWENMQFLSIEVQTRRPGTKVPDSGAIETLSTSGGDAYLQVMKELRTALNQPPSADRQ